MTKATTKRATKRAAQATHNDKRNPANALAAHRNADISTSAIEASVFARENNIDPKRVRARIRRAAKSENDVFRAHIVAHDKRWLFKRASVAALKALFA